MHRLAVLADVEELFLLGVDDQRRRTRLVGDVAWAWSTNRAQGRIGEREIDSLGAELMVLSRAGASWVIRAIHWSSRSAG